MKVQQNDIANVQGRSLAFSSDVGAAYAKRGHSGSTAEQYLKAMNIIVDKKLFDKTITIGSKTMCAQEFLIDYSDELVSYYHGEDNGIMYLYKIAQNGTGVVIAIDVITNKLYDAECRIIVDMTNKALDYLYKE